MLCLSSFLEQVWESRLVFISLSVFELWIITVGLGLFIMRILKFEASYWYCFSSYDSCLLVCVSAVCLRNLHSTVLQTALVSGAFLPSFSPPFTLEVGGAVAGSNPAMDNSAGLNLLGTLLLLSVRSRFGRLRKVLRPLMNSLLEETFCWKGSLWENFRSCY